MDREQLLQLEKASIDIMVSLCAVGSITRVAETVFIWMPNSTVAAT